MNLAIDIGNTLAKAAVFHDGEIVKHSIDNRQSLEGIKTLIEEYIPVNLIISNVGSPIEGLLKNILPNVTTIIFNPDTPVPIKNLYKSRTTLGNDRMAAIVGAAGLFPGENVLIIDAGTCITCDLIQSDRKFEGGSISPGIGMRLMAMKKYTGNLPKITAENFDGFIGFDTNTSMLAGVMAGTKFELDGFIDQYKMLYKNLRVVITGGDHNFFVGKLKNEIFAIPHLVLIGLNKILEYNAK